MKCNRRDLRIAKDMLDTLLRLFTAWLQQHYAGWFAPPGRQVTKCKRAIFCLFSWCRPCYAGVTALDLQLQCTTDLSTTADDGTPAALSTAMA